MKYTVTINQFAIVEAGFDFDLIDAAIFEVLKDYTNSTACRKMQDNEKPFFNVPYKVVIEELPLAKINKPDSIYRRFQKLEQYGIIEMHPDNKRLKQVWFSWGRNYDRMLFRSKTGFKSDQTDFDPAQTGFKSGVRPDLNPPHHNTISYNLPIAGESDRAPEKPEPVKAEKAPNPNSAAPLSPSWNDRPNTDTPAKMVADLRAFYTTHLDDFRVMCDTARIRYSYEDMTEIIAAFCGHRIENNRTADTYRQIHGALQKWLIGEKIMRKKPAATSAPIEIQYKKKPMMY